MDPCSIPDAFLLTPPISPISCPFSQLRTYSRLRRARTGKTEVEVSDPPFLPPGAGAGVWRNLHLRHTPWGVAHFPNYPCGKAPTKNLEDLIVALNGILSPTRHNMVHD